MPNLPIVNEPLDLETETVKIEIGANVNSDDELENDPMAVIIGIEDELWENSPLKNPRLHEKMQQVANDQAMAALTAMRANTDLASPGYHNMYCRMFKALIAKKVASKMSDSCASTPTITHLAECMDSDSDAGMLPQEPEAEGKQEFPSTHNPGNVSFADPMVEDAMAQMCAPGPQWPGKSADSYCRRCDVTIRLGHATNDAPAKHMEDTDSTQPAT